MARKLKDDPNQLMPAGVDLQERVIIRDRERSGRDAPGGESVSNVTTLQESNEETNQPTNEVSKISSKQETKEETNERALRLQRGMAIAAESDEAIVTVRAPAKLNDYVDRYVERMKRIDPKRKYRKQDAIAEMFAAFYADHPMPPAPDEEI